MKHILSFVLILSLSNVYAQYSTQIALLKYGGGGDWYANPTSLPNLVKFCNTNLNSNINPEIAVVSPGSSNLFQYPFVHMTGHGNVDFSFAEVQNLRLYLKAGGFLHIDDNYGLAKYIRPELKKIFPEKKLLELPAGHPIFHQFYDFPKGLPKIHEHDGKPPQAFAIFYNGRMVVLFTYETDLGDGWEDQSVHNDSQATRLKALKMGANILQYVLLKGAISEKKYSKGS